jgi:hypothetical protein
LIRPNSHLKITTSRQADYFSGTTIYAVVSLTVLSTCPSQAAFITQSRVTNFRFLDATPENQTEKEPLRFGAETDDKIFLLDLGEYSSADAGQTFSFVRDAATNAQWEGIRLGMQGPAFSNTTGLPTMWLGSDELEEDEVSNSSQLSRGRLSAGFPTYNLQRVDITVRYYRTGIDDGVTFRTAAFDAEFYWLVPEPCTRVLAMAAIPLLILPTRRRQIAIVTKPAWSEPIPIFMAANP